jgi:hypothetical protein
VPDRSINLGQIAYEAYRDTSHGKSLYSGKSIPEWRLMAPDIQAAWGAAAAAVIASVGKDENAHR